MNQLTIDSLQNEFQQNAIPKSFFAHTLTHCQLNWILVISLQDDTQDDPILKLSFLQDYT